MNPNPIAPTRVPRAARPLVAAVAWLFAAVAHGQEPPTKTPTPGPVLYLPGGGFASGELMASDRPGLVRWRPEAFQAPWEFPLASVEAIRFPVAETIPRAAGAFGFELTGGDILYGSLAALDDKSVELDVERLGRIRLDRARLRRIFRWVDGANLVYNGPSGMTGWREVQPPKPFPRDQIVRMAGPLANRGMAVIGMPPADPPAPAEPSGPAWREEMGQPATDKDGAILQGDFALPARASIELDLSWKQTPDFTIAFGAEDEASAGRAFRLEVWEGQLILLRETDTEADLATIGPIAAGPGRVHLRAFIDQESGRFLVVSEAGETRADLKLGGPARPGLAGLRLTHHRGGLRLERLRVGRWDGEAPAPSNPDAARVELADGSIVRKRIDRFDADAREFVLRDEAGESRIAADRLADAHLTPPADDAPRAVAVLYQDGTRIGGDWAGVEGKTLILKATGIAEPLRLPLDGMRSLEMPARDRKPAEEGDPTGTLEMPGLRLPGRLADAAEGGLAWKPLGTETASPLRPDASGRIVYRTPPPPVVAPRMSTAARNRAAVLSRQAPSPATTNAAPSGRRSLHLRTGDIIPSEVAKIDEDGVTFRTDLSESTFVPHARIKAVELAVEVGPLMRIDKARRERLLTLPRMQKGSPPTHLIRSKNGDILRGRIVGMDDKTIRVEVRQEEKLVPRDRVSRIIWLHADETDPTKKPTEPPPAAGLHRVLAVRSDGIRLTFAAGRVADGAVSGTSDVLGPCKVRLQDVDQLMIGAAVDTEAVRLAYQQWKLQDAPEPRSAQSDGGASPGAAGSDAALVGRPAPDFTLDLLDGAKFHLAEQKGKVILLDFWATWCGPCLQAMPQIDRVAREFEGQGVKLVAVNLQEAPAKITPMLDRLKLHPAVALDRDGVVAEKYGANAIPQTVIIDREGKVFRLFVGGGPHFDDQLREALRALLPAEAP